jgi:hypothetical protein
MCWKEELAELAQPVGRTKIGGGFGRAAASAVDPNTNDGVLFPRSRSDHDVKMSESSLAGTVLASRYRILKTIDAESFKAHDLALDQTVTVRQVLLTSQCASDIWRQKVQQLALLRDPNFLNILDVILDESRGFVITEHPRGQSIADLLSERSRFDLEEVLWLMTPFAGSLDLAAALTCFPDPISACWLFAERRRSYLADPEQRPLSESQSCFVKLDIWELVRPRENLESPFLTSKAKRGGSRGLAVRQAALLTYDLLGGEIKKEGEIKHWFKPVKQLGQVGNSILYLGLQGSPRFKSSENFFRELESAIRSGAGEPRTLRALKTRKHSVALPGTNDVMKKFDRDTEWLATRVVVAVVFAALVVAVLVHERHPNAALQTQLNEIETRAQLAQKIAELAAGQRDAIGTQLREVEKKAQLARQNGDLATSRQSATATELKNAEDGVQPARKTADLAANQFKSEEIEIGKPGSKTGAEASIQPLGSSAQSAQTTRTPSAGLARVSPPAEAANKENEGIDATKQGAPNTVETSPTSTDEPLTAVQNLTNLAQSNESQAGISLPTTSVGASVEPIPRRTQIDKSVKASDEELSLKQLVLDYFRAVASNDVSSQERFFESRVNFYGEGLLSRSAVRASTARYNREWPTRKWEPLGDPEFPKTLHSANARLYEVLQPFTWTVSNDSRHEQGSGTLYVRLWKNTKGEFHIIHVEQQGPSVIRAVGIDDNVFGGTMN